MEMVLVMEKIMTAESIMEVLALVRPRAIKVC